MENNKKKLVVAAILAFVFEVGIVNAVKAEEITLPSPSLNNLPASVTYTRGSIYEYVDGSSSDYDIKFFNGTDTIYKNIQLVSSKIASGTLSLTPTDTQPSYDWTNGKYSGSDVTIEGNTVSGAIRIRASHNDSLPTDWTKYYTYQYTKPTGYEFEGTRINNTIANDGANVQNKIFSNISNNSNGAVIYNNNKDLSSVDIISDFVGNKTSGMGSAIYNLANNGENNSKINSIKGNFIGNNSGSTSADAFGAIGNRTTVKGNAYIGTIEGDFVGNSAKVGAAIRNYSSRNDSGIAEIGSIKGNFIGNYSSDWGGAIANTGKITNIIGDFINNNSSKGGAIDNSRYMDNDELFIENIYGDFISNTSTTAGGAITNNAGIIKNINSNFIGNHSKKGGAICNYNDKSYGVAQITKIAGDFVSNISEEAGGAIYNDSAQKITTIGVEDSQYNSNIAKTEGGVIYNKGTISAVNGNFYNNMALGTGNSNGGGVIYNNASIETIDGTFSANTAKNGGVIYNYQGTIENIKGSFDGNSSTYGGVIRNNAKNYSESGTESVLTIGDEDSTFSNNTATQGGVVQNSVDGEIKIINGTFSNNKATDKGGVIYNNGKILEVNGIYSENLSDNTAAVIYNSSTGNIETINADFIENIAKAEGSIQNDEGVIGTISGLFKKNITSRGNSGIRNTGTITLVNADFVGNMSGTGEGVKLNTILSNEGTISGITSNFIGNTSSGERDAGIWNAPEKSVNILATKNLLFYGNKNNVKYNNSGSTISYENTSKTSYMDLYNKGGTVGMNASGGNVLFFGGVISGEGDDAIININEGSENTGGKYVFNNEIKNNKLILHNGAYVKFGAVKQIDVDVDSLDSDNINTFVSNVFDSDGNAKGDYKAVFDNNTPVNSTFGLLKVKYLTTKGTESATIDTKNEHFETHEIENLTLASDLNVKLDIKLDDDISKCNNDKFKIGSANAGKYLVLDTTDFEDYTKSLSEGKEVTLQIIQATNDNLQLTWEDAKDYADRTLVSAVMFSSDKLGNDYYLSTSAPGKTHDSITFRGEKDTFRNWAEFDTTDDKTFTFVDDTTYTLTKDTNLAGNKITIVGSDNILDSNSKTLFTTVESNQDIKFQNITLQNAKDVTNNNKLTFENATIDSVITNNTNSELTLNANSGNTITFDKNITGSNYTLNLTGDDTGSIVLNNETTTNNANLENVTLKLGKTDTLKNAVLNATSGSIDVQDSEFKTYNIKKLTSDEAVTYNIDISYENDELVSDSFAVGAGSTGIINLGSLSISEDLPNDVEKVVRIIYATGDNAPQLTYDGASVLAEATAEMTSAQILAKGFGLFTTSTTNDSIKVRGLQDTFKAWVNLDTNEHKKFTFVGVGPHTISDTISFDGNNNATIINNSTLTNEGVLAGIKFENNSDFTNNSEFAGVIENNGNLVNNAILVGTIKNFEGAKLTLNEGASIDGTLVSDGGDVVISSGNFTNHNIGALKGNGNFELDISYAGGTIESDTITLTSDTSDSAVVKITKLNESGTRLDNFEKRILIGAKSNTELDISAIKSLFDKSAINVDKSVTHELTTSTINWDDIYGEEQWTETYKQELTVVGSAKGLHDTLKFATTKIDETEHVYNPKADNLSLINKYTGTGSEDRQFNFDNSSNNYIVTNDIGSTVNGKLTINGKASGENRSTLDFAQIIDDDTTVNHKGFELNNDNTEIVLKNVEVKGSSALVSGNSTDVKVVLDNVNLHDNGTGISTFGDLEVKGNSTISDNINVMSETSKIDINGSKAVTINSTLAGVGTSTLALHEGTVNLGDNAKIQSLDTTLQDVKVNLSEGASLAVDRLTLNGNNVLNIANENSFNSTNNIFNDNTTVNIANNTTQALNLGNLTLNSNLKMKIDADLANEQIDTINAISATINSDSRIQIEKINLMSPTTKKELNILFTNNSTLADAVDYIGDKTIAYSPIYKYRTSYVKSSDGGYFRFVVPAKDNFNPAAVSSLVTSQAGVQATINNVFNYAFQNADSFTKLPSKYRYITMNANRYAINETNMNSQNDFDAGVSTDFNQNLNLSRQYKDNSAIWFRPYAVFENIHLKNGPRVDAVSYGSLVGFDTDFIKLKNGWDSVISGYIGYNGAQLHYNGIDTSMSGGVLGVTQTLYKKNFWTALTASTGAFVAETHSMYGKEDTTSIMAGIASKTGYNFEFKEGKFIIQPIWLMSYSIINTFDYTNAAGVRIDSKPIHTIQLNPSLRFIGNVKGWQPYAAVGMVWNIMDKTVAMANSVRLPEMHIKPYVQYGVGVQKTIGEHFTAFGQAMLHNGGRNGIALTGGFRWTLDWKKNQTVKNPTNVKTVIKNNVKHSSKKVSKHNDANYEKMADKTIIKQLSKN